MLALWAGGQALTLAYALAKGDAPLILNYARSIVSLGMERSARGMG